MGSGSDPVVTVKLSLRIQHGDAGLRHVVLIMFTTGDTAEIELSKDKFNDLLHSVVEQEMQDRFFRH